MAQPFIIAASAGRGGKTTMFPKGDTRTGTIGSALALCRILAAERRTPPLPL